MASLIGQTISHYTIFEKLGGGGIGVVYKAEDTKLNRSVGLKFLAPAIAPDPLSKERFSREAQLASGLQHPNICAVHDLGETSHGLTFIVMEYYDGEPLTRKIERGPLPIEEAVQVAAEIAKGLSRAHQHGIVHRDIKPANVILTTDGRIKILDFELARLSCTSLQTKSVGIVGTVAYMFPEQARGEEEAFEDAARQRVGQRPRDKSQLKGILVLPFENLSSEKGNEHFSDGLTEEVITSLSKQRKLRVCPRTTAMRY